MKEISINILKILFIFIIFLNVAITTCYAGFWGDILESGDSFLQDASEQELPINEDDLKLEINKLYNMLLTIGIVVAVLVGAALGIKFIIGSIEEQAKIKEILVPYVVGCIIIFGAFGIWKVVMLILSGIKGI